MEASNSQRFGTFVAQAMEKMERDFPDAKMGDIGLIVEFQSEDPLGENPHGITTTRFMCTDPRNHLQLGLLRAATLTCEKAK